IRSARVRFQGDRVRGVVKNSRTQTLCKLSRKFLPGLDRMATIDQRPPTETRRSAANCCRSTSANARRIADVQDVPRTAASLLYPSTPVTRGEGASAQSPA